MDRVLDALIREAPDAEVDNAMLEAARRSARHRRLFQLLTAALLLLAAGAALFFYSLNLQLAASVTRMQALRVAMEENRKLLGFALDLEAALRGYLLTGDEQHLAGYEAADRAIPQQIRLLEDLLVRQETLAAELAEIKTTLAAKRAELAAVQRSYERDSRREVRRSYRRDLGERKTNTLRNRVGIVEARLEEAAVRERDIAAQLMDQQFRAIVITLSTVGLIGFAALVLGRRHFDTVRRQSELSIALARAQRHSEDKTFFLAQVSHEIRTPMNAIFGYSGLLQDRLEDPSNRRYIDAITSSAQALLAVVNDLLDYSSIEAGKVGFTKRPSDLRDIVDAVASLLMPQAVDKRLSLDTVIDEDVPAALFMDGDRVRQMLLNLISNAVKYTDRGGVTVQVSAESGSRAQTATCSIEVIDTGPGIAEANQAKIFEPFVRCHVGASSGSGLGLSITRRLARVMGGDVHLISRPGVGSRFRLVLPDLPIVPAVIESARAEVRLRDLAPLRVLAVDDVELNREVISAVFARSEHVLRVAGSAAQALDILKDWRADVALLDVRMPEMDGNELARLLREQQATRHMPLIAVTATRLDANGDNNGDLFDGVVLKPFTEQALAAVLADVLDVDNEATIASGNDGVIPAPSMQLLADLRNLESHWQSLSGSLTIRDVRDFASTVQELGRRYSAPGLLRYGRKLANATAAFDVAQTELLLAAFSDQVLDIERLVGVGSDAPQ